MKILYQKNERNAKKNKEPENEKELLDIISMIAK